MIRKSLENHVPEKIAKEIGHNSLFIKNKLELRSDEDYTYMEQKIIDSQDFIWDDARKILLNEHYELGIGDDVYVFFNKNLEVKIIDGHINTLTGFRNSPKGLSEVPNDLLNGYTYINSPQNFFDNIYYPDDNIETRTITYRIEKKVEVLDCEPLRRDFEYELWKIDSETDVESLVEGDWELLFGDSTPSQLFTNQWGFETFHIYPDNVPEDYILVVSVSYIDDEGVTQTITDTQTIMISAECSKKVDTVEEDEEDATNKMESKLYFKTDILGTYAGARTRGWKLNNSGNWRKDYNTELDVNIDVTFRDEDCNLVSQADEFDDCNSCFRRKATLRQYFEYNRKMSDNEVFSVHNATFENGSTFSTNLVLTPCE